MGQVISAAFPTIIEAIKGCLGLNESVEDLETQVNQLTNQLADLQTKLTNLERGGKRRTKQEVVSLIEQATKLTKDFPTLKERTIQGQWWEKYLSIERVKKMREAVENARNELRNIGELTVDVDESTIPSLVVSQLSGKTSNDNLEKLYGWLEDDKVSSIGVSGMGGVGKTTLVRHIHNKILQKMSGVKVYWVTVSQHFSIEKLQDDIAKKIGGLEFVDEDEDQRAAILHKHLVGKKTVLILDDVWECIPLEKLGNPRMIEGCKFIITSRSSEMCNMIGCQKIFKVDVFNEEEAWNLFKQILLPYDHTVVSNAIEEHAKSLAKKCGGLPLALKTVAASMRGVNDDHIWRNAVKNFQNASQLETLENDVFQRLEFSYNRLNDQRLKECFLYCCLYPEDYHIEKDEIIMKLIAERLCEDIDEGHSILKKLVDVFLLEEVVGVFFFEKEECVMMHDLMREMALKISKFMVKFEIPEGKYWTAELERVSLSSRTLKEIPNDFSPICHKLLTLNLTETTTSILIRGRGIVKEIPESFLKYLLQLQVLDLSYNYELKCLPDSISNLENLCGLFLQGCGHISCLPAMKKMKKLRVLNIEGCYGIRELPQDMECLVSLQYLYMRHTSKELEIPKGIISKLRNLKCIQLDNCGRLQSEDLNCLEDLQEFWSWFDELHNFNRLVKNLEQLKCYNISVSTTLDFHRQTLNWGSNVRKVDFTEINFTLVLLPANITSLRIKDCEGLNGCITDYLQSIMSNLKELDVERCTGVEWILNSEQIIENASNTGATPFKSLEALTLRSLPNLISVCKGEDVILPDYCNFSSLKHLCIIGCDSMKKLLPHALLQNLKNLEKLDVRFCSQLKVVIGGVGGDGEEEGSSNTPIYLPKLKELSLYGLPKLKSICNGREMIFPSIEKITIFCCTNVKRMPSFLPINEATEQPYIPSSFRKIELFKFENEWWESLDLHNPNAKHILQSHIQCNSSNFQTVATNNAGPSRIISSAKPSNKASTYQPNPKSYTTPIIGIGNCSKCGELGHRSNECTTQMFANLIKEYVEDDEKRDGYDEEDIKVVEDVGDPVNSCMQRHHEEEKSPNQHNISRANGNTMEKILSLRSIFAGYMGFDENLETLKAEVDQLLREVKDMEAKLKDLERGGQKERKQGVEGWLERVDKLKTNFETFKESIQGGGFIMKNARKLIKAQELEGMTESVKKLREEGRNNTVEPTLDVSTAYELNVDQLSGTTSETNLDKIYKLVEDENVRSIGVYGMGGVGKTTLVKHIHNQILRNDPRANVYWVTVSHDFNLRKLQDNIAKSAGIDLSDDQNEVQRAAILLNHFVEKNNVVLILDDVWDNISLENLGVPPRAKGCKLILTTRLRDVCRRIGCEKLFQVNAFNEEEGWNLFKEILVQDGCIVLTDVIEKYAKQLAKKCGGLPLALNIAAASMRGVNDDRIWSNAINNFQNASLQLEKMETNMFEILKFSYNRLTDPSLKECFLYCCLYPEDEEIEKDEIIMKLIAEGLCEDIDEGHSIFKQLVDVFLLEGGYMYVKMHDLMREMALKISKFMVKFELVEIPEEKHWTAELERVSLNLCTLKEIPTDFSPICHKLSTLNLRDLYSWETDIKEIPESFLLYMSQLQVLDLSYNNELECLPNSISNLENLCGLFLQGCSNISCLPAMKKMKKLRVLNIEECNGIRELPQDMECLVSLQYLYMRGTSIDLEIPKGVISKLRNLKCIRSDYCERLQSEDFNCLEDLQEFWSCFDELHNFNRLVKNLERLKCYDICVRSRSDFDTDFKRKNLPLGSNVRKVDFREINFTLVLLPANITSLHIYNCEGLNGYIADYFQSIMSNLKELAVWKCTEVEWILNSEQIIENASSTGATPFKSLEKLTLWWLPHLISVCKGEDVILPANCTFSSLKYLFIYDCGMKKLSLLQNLKNLETLYVMQCSQLEVVIGGVGGDGEEEGSSNTPIYLPKLKVLYLDELPKLKSICNGREMICPSIEKITIYDCTNVKRMPSFLPINEATKQPYIPSSFQKIKLTEDEKEWWESLELHNPNAKHILQSYIEW
nr:probable disease resistance protein At1g12290 isoform X2 [Ipomoea batatas]